MENNKRIKRLLVMELVNDDLNFDAIGAAISNLVQLENIVPPQRVQPVRNEEYYEITIPNYTPDDFHNHFRMSRITFQKLLTHLHQRNGEISDGRIIIEKKLLFTIWLLAKPESFIAAGDRFNLAKSTSHQIFFSMVNLLSSLRHEFIIRPDENERQRISRSLQAKSGIPGIIGAIDGCHIAIKAPPHNAVDYYNRNNHHSIILQGICNDKKLFIDIFVDTPGRVHDARVFRNSDVYALLTSSNPPLNENEHLLGDAAYPLLPCLMKPYRDNGHLNPRQTRFNIKMSSVRSMIEQAFGLLKSKFRRLKYLDMARIDMEPKVVTAACVLHNFIIFQEGIELYEDDINFNGPPPEEMEYYANNNDEVNAENVAQHKRDYIAYLLH